MLLCSIEMGLINNDNYVASNGVEKVGTYLSFAFETLYLRQSGPGQYSVNANYRVYWDQACREAGKPFMDLRSLSTSLSKEALETNLYGVMYNALKELYPNCSDELTRTVQPVSAVPSDSSAAPAAAPAPATAPTASAPAVETTPAAPAVETTPASSEPTVPTPDAPANPSEDSAQNSVVTP